MTSLQHPPSFMATQNHHQLRDDGPMDPDQKFKESFIEASYQKEKALEFDRKYPVSDTLNLDQRHLEIKMVIPDPQVITEEPAKASLGYKLKESSDSTLGVDGERTEDCKAAIINSNHSHNLPSTRPITDNPSNVTLPNPTVSREIQAQQFNPTRTDDVITLESESSAIDMPSTPSASPPHEDNKLDLLFFIADLGGALTNLYASSRAKQNYQAMIYTLVGCFTLGFLISATALMLHKKRPAVAKKMQKAVILIVVFGFLGMMGMLFPASITWWFTVSSYLVFLLMLAVAAWIFGLNLFL